MSKSLGRRIAALGLSACLLGMTGCQDEGPAERAGKQVDEAMESLTEGSEGALEKAGRKLDEAVEDTREAVGSED
jgi:hyperosmotically inducible protein